MYQSFSQTVVFLVAWSCSNIVGCTNEVTISRARLLLTEMSNCSLPYLWGGQVVHLSSAEAISAWPNAKE